MTNNRTPAGLIVPQGTTMPLSDENQKLLALEDRLDTNSLQASLLDAYLKMAKTEENGVVKYKTLSTPDTDTLATRVMEALAYHVNVRHYGLSPELLEQLKTVKGASGENYLDTIVQSLIPVSSAQLKTAFKKEPVGLSQITELSQQLGQTYSQRAHAICLDNTYGKDLPKLRTGLINLNQALNISKDITEESLASSGMEDLTRTYLQAIYQGRSKR